MTSTAENNKRIAKNTAMLYIRMLLIMAVTLYTSRVVLKVLGVEDFGIYNVVGGVVAMFSILSGSLSASISRFITFELGKGEKGRLKEVFSSAVTIQLGLSFIVVLLAESIGVWFLNYKMNISSDRLYAANWVLQCSILTFVINLISVPYNASIIAHEHMKAFAYISIIEVILKLVAVFVLSIFLFDKLIVYAVLLLAVSLGIRLIYGIYCSHHFAECHYYFIYEKKLLREMTSFAGWNFIGSTSGVLRDQGVNILINIFYGPAVNAARGIAVQVNTAVQSFLSNFMTALNPQIIKSYASNDREYMLSLLYQGARFSFYILFLLALPLIIEAEMVLHLWLNTVPEHTVNFVRLILLLVLSESISSPLITAMLATGRIRNYQILVGGLQMLNFPISYLFLLQGASPESTFIIAIVISQCCLLARLYMLRKMIGLSFKIYVRRVYLNVLIVGIISSIVPVVLYSHLSLSITRFIVELFVCLLCSALTMFYIGCTQGERTIVRNKIEIIRNKLIGR